MSITSNKLDAIVLLGDSITEFSWGPSGLASTLARSSSLVCSNSSRRSQAEESFLARQLERYVRKLDVVNRGFSGYSTR